MSVLLVTLMFGLALNANAARCALGSDALGGAINGDSVALASLESEMSGCLTDYRFFGLYNAVCFARPGNERQRMRCARNLASHDDSKLLALGYAIELHANRQCGSEPRIIALLRLIGASGPRLEEELMLSAMRYGDIHVAREYAVTLKGRKDAQSMQAAALILGELKRREDAAQHRQLLDLESKDLPAVDDAVANPFRWIREVPRNPSELCNDAGQFE